MRRGRMMQKSKPEFRGHFYLTCLLLSAVIILSLQACKTTRELRAADPEAVIPYEADPVGIAYCVVEKHIELGYATGPTVTTTDEHVRVAFSEFLYWEALLKDGKAEFRYMDSSRLIDYLDGVVEYFKFCNQKLLSRSS